MDMNYNFDKMNERIIDSLNKTDLIDIKEKLKKIKSPTLVSGVGGSYVVAKYLAKVLERKNNTITDAVTSRDFLYKNILNYKSVICCSYSGNNLGVDISFNNDLNKYLFSRNMKDGIININYRVDDIEKSFISLSSTMIPMTIALNYYLDGNIDIVNEIINDNIRFNPNDKNIYEIITGYDTIVPSIFLDSTMVESGIAIPILHDKYDFCHGRSTLGYNNDTNMILFNSKKQLDELLIKELAKYYKDMIIFDKKYDDDIINEYYLTYISMYLCKDIAMKKNKDLSNVDYCSIVKKLYKYKGEV